MGRGESSGVRHVSHPDSVSGHAPFPPDGKRRPSAPSRLESVRYGARRLPPQAHATRRTGARLRLAVRPSVLALLDLAPPSQRLWRRLARRGYLPRHVVPIQALESLLASPDQASPGALCLETVGRVLPYPALAVPS